MFSWHWRMSSLFSRRLNTSNAQLSPMSGVNDWVEVIFVIFFRQRYKRNSIKLVIYFSRLKVILGAKVINVTTDAMYFNVDDDGRLWHVYSASDVWMSTSTLSIRVVARSGKKWSLDPPFQECLLYCSLWVKKKNLFKIWIGIRLIINGKSWVLVEMVKIWSFSNIRLS